MVIEIESNRNRKILIEIESNRKFGNRFTPRTYSSPTLITHPAVYEIISPLYTASLCQGLNYLELYFSSPLGKISQVQS